MPIYGDRMGDKNLRLRMLIIFFVGILMGGVMLYWRTQYLDSQEYIEFPVGTQVKASGHRGGGNLFAPQTSESIPGSESNDSGSNK